VKETLTVELQEQLKTLQKQIRTLWVLGLLKFIPDPIADKIVNKLLGLIGL
jgi:hypothetical protein